MITIRKLQTLPKSLRYRKIVTIFQEIESCLKRGAAFDVFYLSRLTRYVLDDKILPVDSLQTVDRLSRAVRRLADVIDADEQTRTSKSQGERMNILRLCNAVHHAILKYLGAEPADWDYGYLEQGQVDISKRLVMPIKVYLEDVRSPFNVGAVFRSAESFGVAEIILSPLTPSPEHKKARRTAMGCERIVPWRYAPVQELREEQSVFALECGGTDIGQFEFPKSGIVVIGSEELGVSPEALSIASGKKVTISTSGAKGSLNVSVAFGILIHAWWDKLRA